MWRMHVQSFFLDKAFQYVTGIWRVFQCTITQISAFFDIICVSETYLDLETCTDDQSLEIPDYYMLHTDLPSFK